MDPHRRAAKNTSHGNEVLPQDTRNLILCQDSASGLEFAKSQRAVENREKMEETGCEVICGAPTTPAVKGKVR